MAVAGRPCQPSYRHGLGHRRHTERGRHARGAMSSVQEPTRAKYIGTAAHCGKGAHRDDTSLSLWSCMRVRPLSQEEVSLRLGRSEIWHISFGLGLLALSAEPLVATINDFFAFYTPGSANVSFFVSRSPQFASLRRWALLGQGARGARRTISNLCGLHQSNKTNMRQLPIWLDVYLM